MLRWDSQSKYGKSVTNWDPRSSLMLLVPSTRHIKHWLEVSILLKDDNSHPSSYTYSAPSCNLFQPTVDLFGLGINSGFRDLKG